MNLLYELNKAGFKWEIRPSANHHSTIRVEMTSPEGVVVAKELMPTYISKDRNFMDVLIVKCLLAFENRPEILSRWYEVHGNYRARMTADAVVGGAENASYLTHVALRKLIDGPESVILWNGYHAMDDETGKLYTEFLWSQLKDIAETPEASVPNLRAFCDNFRGEVVAFFEDRANFRIEGRASAIPEDQRQINKTLMYSMSNAFKNLSGDDLVFGFFGYIFEKFPD